MNTYKLYEQLKAAFPKESAEALAHVLSEVAEEIQNTVTKQDFAELKATVHELAEAQKRTDVAIERLTEAQKRTDATVDRLAEAQGRTEERVGSLEAAVERLAEAQRRTEERVGSLEAAVDRLIEAQKRTDVAIERLTEAQKRTDATVQVLVEAQNRIEATVHELAEAQRRTEESLRLSGLRVEALFSRSGPDAEAAFRDGLREIVSEAGYKVEVHRGQDPEGYINYDPGRSYELDVLVRNGTVIAVEIKSSVDSHDVVRFVRTVSLFERQTGRRVNKRVMIAASRRQEARQRAKELGVALGIDPDALQE